MPDLERVIAHEFLRHSLRIVLVEPAGGLNVGAIARVMKNMGLYRLILVNPTCDPMGSDARQMAVHGIDVLEAAQQVESIPDALIGCQRVAATTARDRAFSMTVEPPEIGLSWILEQNYSGQKHYSGQKQPEQGHLREGYPERHELGRHELERNGQNLSSRIPCHDKSVKNGPDAAILFGPEDRGLSNAELVYAQRLIKIPTNPEYESLNLAQAVAICCYELNQLAKKERKSPQRVISSPSERSPLDNRSPENEAIQDEIIEEKQSHDNSQLAPFEAVEGYYQHLEAVLLDIGYLYPHTAQHRMAKFRHLFNRAQLTHNEVAMLRGVLRQMQWAMGSSQPDHVDEES